MFWRTLTTMTAFASGENYSIELEATHAKAKVWRRPDLDSSAGAADAQGMVKQLKLLAATLTTLVLDLREAPSVAGPKTVETMEELFATCEKLRVKVAIVLSEDPLQLLQFRRLAETHAPQFGMVSTNLEAVESSIRA